MRILFVESNHVVSMVLKYLFENAPTELELVHCDRFSAASKQIATGKPFDFAIADLDLSDAPNGEIAELTLQQSIPTIVLTSNYDEALRDKLFKQGVVDYIIKESRYSYEYVVRLVCRLQKNREVKVLLADDSSSYRKLIKRQLEAYQYQVIDVADGQQALDQLALNPDIRLIITDHEMPIMNGIELVRQVRKDFDENNIRIIGLSASDRSALTVKFIKNGANDFLKKPFNYEELHCRVLQNIEQAELLEQVKSAAYIDMLTGLHNRRYLMEKTENDFNQSEASWSLAMLDLDHFKTINDQWGHDAGDHVLKQIGEMLRGYFSSFLASRIGGEEFCILLRGLSLSQAEQLMQNVCRLIEQTDFYFNGELLPVTASIGICQKQDGENLSDTMNRADELLYSAKNAGRNQVACA